MKYNFPLFIALNYFHTVNFPFSNTRQSTGQAIEDLSKGNKSSKSLSES